MPVKHVSSVPEVFLSAITGPPPDKARIHENPSQVRGVFLSRAVSRETNNKPTIYFSKT